MQFRLPLLAVEDVAKSKAFYEELFEQTVVLDLGKNITMSGGFALQEDFNWFIDMKAESIVKKSNNMELYFEVDDFEAFLVKLAQYPEIELVHPIKKYDWQQRVIRIYDPDWHIIEIGESMAVIARRYLAEGYSVEETAKIIQHPKEFVEYCSQESGE